MLGEAIKKVVARENLTILEAEEAMNSIMKGEVTPAQIAALLVALRMKGETIEEITGCAKAMKSNAVGFGNSYNVDLEKEHSYAIDTCGTGGDGGKTFNISTAVAIVTAAGGVKVLKHGNRAVSSRSGSADVLTELGLNIDMKPEEALKCYEAIGMTFLFAQKYHTAMKNAAPVRKELGIKTIFNLLGPLTNPGNIRGQMLGIFDGELTHAIAEVLLNLGRERAMVVHGEDGLDEITTTGITKVSEVRDGSVIDYIINPRDYGIPLCKAEEISGGDTVENAAIIKDIFKGKKGAKRDIVVLNSAAALYVGKRVNSINEGVELAKEIIDSGKAYEKLNEIVNYSKRVGNL